MIDAGYEYDPHTLVLRRAEQALAAGMGGIVCSAERSGGGAQDRRAGAGGGDARHPAGGRRPWRPEARDDARRGDPRRRQPSRRRPPDRRRGRQGGGGAGDPRRDGAADCQEEDDGRRDTGSPMSMCAIPRATRAMSRPRSLAFDKYGARFLARGGAHEKTEGPGRPATSSSSSESLSVAHDCYHSPEYQRAGRHPPEGFADAEMVLVEGCRALEPVSGGLGRSHGPASLPIAPAIGTEIEAGQTGADLETR